MSAPSGDTASASVYVAVSPEDAFDVFTREIDLWWKQGPKFRIAGKKPGRLHFEPALGGGVFETVVLSAKDASPSERTFHVGTVTAFDPPRSLSLEWRLSNFAPDEKTFVEITFAPMGVGTLVSVRHSGWSKLRAGHPARHGLEGAAFARMIGMWWGELMTALREHVATRVLPVR
ncbi:MAG TPA: SRPBCC domain-containing protein [Polyangiaceae bacterium]|jgi:uncharacterized protein YndB with AHSA1/START domain|nr:SRPBCC domain-containing protein [Polyangiaceae bacterium]